MIATRSSMRWLPLAAALTIAGGIAVGWLLPSVQAPTFDYAYALLSPACCAAICIGTLLGGSDRARWLVPLVLVAVVLNVANHPHTPGLSAVAVAAGVVAVASTLCRHKRLAIAGALSCCAVTSASLLVALGHG